MDEQMQGLLALYALGGLNDDEQKDVEAYLENHPEAEAALREMQLTVGALSHTAVPIPPSPQMEEALMARVTADAQARSVRKPVEPVALQPQSTRASWWERLRAFLSLPVWRTAVAVALLVLIVGSLLWRNRMAAYERQLTVQADAIQTLQMERDGLRQANEELATAVADAAQQNGILQAQLEALQQERDAAQMQAALLADENAELTRQTAVLQSEIETQAGQLLAAEMLAEALQRDLDAANQVLALFASPDVQLVSLPGTESQPQAAGQLLFDPNTTISLLLVDGMQDLGPGQVYQVLLIREDGHDTAETFAVDVQGQRALIVHSLTPMETFTAVGVSIEPAGGSPQRTGDIILLGELLGS
jgi:FtsZ-binding cell division protein ZapB